MTGHADTEPVEARAAERVITTPFGNFEVDEADVLVFPQGLPGFERCRRFVLISSAGMAPLRCLHALDGPPASFVAVDPRLVEPGYRGVLAEDERDRLGAADEASLVWLALATLDADGRAAVNLRAPIVINPTRMVGLQAVSRDDRYPLRRTLTLE